MQYYLVFLLAFAFFAYLQNTPGMADPDSFYHIKMAQLIAQNGVPREFPYLPYTIFSNYFTDHHLLYHIALVPFVTLLNPVVGAKLAQALFASLTVLAFYWLLKKLKVPLVGFFTLALALTSPFIFRVSLIKVPALSILVLLIATYLIIEKRWRSLFVLSFFFVWLYGGFLLVVILTGIFVFFEWIYQGKKTGVWFSWPLPRLLLASGAGVILGVVINPYFPQNLTFYWEQVIQIGLVNYQKVIGVGGEWYPYPFLELVSATAFVWILVIGALTISIINYKKITWQNLAIFIFALMFFIFTLKSRRYVEYFVPFTVLWTGVAIRDAVSTRLNFAALANKARLFYRNYPASATAAAVYFMIGIPLLAFMYVHGTKNSLKGYSVNKFSGAGQWLNKNSTNQLIFHNDWDDFPVLFFHDSANAYIVGLDPTFMYKYDQKLYWTWVNITTGKQTDKLYDTIKNEFKAGYVFVDSEHEALENNIKADERFSLVYQDKETKIFEIL